MPGLLGRGVVKRIGLRLQFGGAPGVFDLGGFLLRVDVRHDASPSSCPEPPPLRLPVAAIAKTAFNLQ